LSERLVALLVALIALSACSEEPLTLERSPALLGNVAHGRELVIRFECARCHAQGAAKSTSRCVGCHQAIGAAAKGGSIDEVPIVDPPRDKIALWDERIVHFRELPSFIGATRLLRREWLRDFLLDPHDLRPRLDETMPALPMTAEEADDVVAYLGTLDDVVSRRDAFFRDEHAGDYERDGDLGRGARLFAEHGCASCHAMSGVLAQPRPAAGVADTRALELAPDLRFTRERFQPERLVPWLLQPSFYKHDSAMPDNRLTEQEGRDLAAFIMKAPLAAQPAPERPLRLPPLDRPVGWDEVSAEVFGKVCIHCHSDPDAEMGDGGPGFAGGFGMPMRKLDLTDYESTFAGYLDDDGKRRSVFEPSHDGTPRLVAALWARWEEQQGKKAAVRGMPLGLPALSVEQIQLVESWVAQGRPR
jgi:mono/diheme cytochrome c family protein